jgi:hypothetical protein
VVAGCSFGWCCQFSWGLAGVELALWMGSAIVIVCEVGSWAVVARVGVGLEF